MCAHSHPTMKTRYFYLALSVGVSLGLPLLLYQRQLRLDQSTA